MKREHTHSLVRAKKNPRRIGVGPAVDVRLRHVAVPAADA